MARILLIEDNDQQRETYATLLYYNGFDVEQAATAEAGLAAAHQRRPDLILIDSVLSGMDGLYATKLLKDSPPTADIPVICISAKDIPMAAIRNARADGFLRKPLSGDTLVKGIRELIGFDETRIDGPVARHRAVIIAGKESATAAALMASLKLEGFQVSRAADGATGIGVVSTIEPDVVMVDLESPVLDGWAVLQRIRQSSNTANIPVLAFSHAPAPEERQRALEAGFAGYLDQVDREHVSAELGRYVKQQKESGTQQ